MRFLPLSLSLFALVGTLSACQLEGLFGTPAPVATPTPDATAAVVEPTAPPLPFRGYARFKGLVGPLVATMGATVDLAVQLEWNDTCIAPTTLLRSVSSAARRVSFSAMVGDASSSDCVATVTTYTATLSFVPLATGTFTVTSPESSVLATLDVVATPVPDQP